MTVLDLEKLKEPLLDGRILQTHQIESIDWFLKKVYKSPSLKGGILALDMGLGKTLIALVIADLIKAELKSKDLEIIVICPATLKKNWVNEAKSVDLNLSVYSWSKLPIVPTHDYILIADEAHYAQSGTKSQRGKQFLKLAKSKKSVINLLLTGTPLKNGRPINLLPLLSACNHPLSFNKYYYEAHFCAGRRTPFCAWDTNGASNLPELHLSTKDVILRKSKEDCLDLPPKTRIFKDAELTDPIRKVYVDAIKTIKGQTEQKLRMLDEVEKTQQILLAEQAIYRTALLKLRQVTEAAKIDSTASLIQQLLEQNEQVVVFVEFLESIKELKEIFREAIVLTGDTPVNSRQGLVDSFQKGEKKLFLTTSKAGGVGITLTSANYVLLVSRPWTPGDAYQAEDRCNRIGQTKPVFSYWLQLGNLDKTLDKVLCRKGENIELVLNGKVKRVDLKDMTQMLVQSELNL